MHLRGWLVFLMIVLAVPTILVVPTFARPITTIAVTTFSDVTANDGVCSLREAVQSANTDTPSGGAAGECPAGSGADTITLPSGTYPLAGYGFEDNNLEGDLDIASIITIQGTAPLTITTCAECNPSPNQDRLFHIHPNGGLDLANVTLAESGPPGNLVFPNDPTVPVGESGGAILAAGEFLTVTSVTFANNHAGDGNNSGGSPQGGPPSAGGFGGAIAVLTGTVAISDSTFINNSAGTGGQEDSSITADGGFGGAVFVGNGVTGTITRSLLQGNRAGTSPLNDSGGYQGGSGGAIALDGTLTIRTSAIVYNESGEGYKSGNGGGLFVGSGATLTMWNSTISNNTTALPTIALNGDGAGLYIQDDTLVNLLNSTVAYNRIPTTGSDGAGGGLYIQYPAMVAGNNTIVASNQSHFPSAGPDCLGTLDSSGYLFIHQGAGCLSGGGIGDIYGEDPLLLALADNGGDTLTHALPANSPALDAGGCNPGTDQRGFPRPVDIAAVPNGGNGCDMGAFEAKAELATPTVTPTPTITATPSTTPSPTPFPPNAICRTPNLPLGDGQTVNDTITITATGTVADVNLYLRVDHTAVGQLVYDLENSEHQEYLFLNGFCNGDNINHVLDNDQGYPLNACRNDPQSAYPPNTRLNAPLGSFEETPLQGNWTLTISDFGIGADSGTFVEWCLIPETVATATATPTVTPTPPEATMTATATGTPTATTTMTVTPTGTSVPQSPTVTATGTAVPQTPTVTASPTLPIPGPSTLYLPLILSAN